ncbi:RDD family protein [Marinilabilia rubra]|uniref:RDD family protein n=1 Tax=Marinilabilia rubra TaxID=2162893 RepID=A0A2U2BDH0_9BACT|nr:RDD family protein [Marinilabilia rubra]PWE01108.1 RDD family protein [Marinilabilia rubra]
METIELNTTQNVSLEFPIASVADRILAYFLDVLIILAYGLVLSVVLFAWLGMEPGFWLIIFALPAFFYHLVFEIFLNGQSPGKRAMKIKVFKADGSQVTSANCFIRWIFRLADISLTSGALATITIIVNGKGQRLGDIAAGTTILKTSKKHGFNQTLWMDVEENYQPRFPEAEVLSDQDVQVIKEVIQATSNTEHRPDTYVELLSSTRKAIERKTNTNSSLPDKEYLSIMIKDYNACHREA